MPKTKYVTPDINLNLNVRGIPLSATLLINEKSNQLRKEGKTVYKLGLGQSPFPVPQSVVDAIKNKCISKRLSAGKRTCLN